MENQQLQIDLRKTTPIKCNLCKNATFTEGVFLRKISKFLTGAPQDSIYPIPAFMCAKCGSVNEEFLPPVLKQIDGENKEASESKEDIV